MFTGVQNDTLVDGPCSRPINNLTIFKLGTHYPCPRAVSTARGHRHPKWRGPCTRVSTNDTRVHGLCWSHGWPTPPVNTGSVYRALLFVIVGIYLPLHQTAAS